MSNRLVTICAVLAASKGVHADLDLGNTGDTVFFTDDPAFGSFDDSVDQLGDTFDECAVPVARSAERTAGSVLMINQKNNALDYSHFKVSGGEGNLKLYYKVNAFRQGCARACYDSESDDVGTGPDLTYGTQAACEDADKFWACDRAPISNTVDALVPLSVDYTWHGADTDVNGAAASTCTGSKNLFLATDTCQSFEKEGDLDVFVNACDFVVGPDENDQVAIKGRMTATVTLQQNPSPSSRFFGIGLPNKVVETTSDVTIQMETTLDLTTESAEVYGPYINEAVMVTNVFDPVTETMELFWLTSVQEPYMFQAGGPPLLNDVDLEGASWKCGPTTEVTSVGSGCPAGTSGGCSPYEHPDFSSGQCEGRSSGNTVSDCGQYWKTTCWRTMGDGTSTDAKCATEYTLDLDSPPSGFVFQFATEWDSSTGIIECQDSFTGACEGHDNAPAVVTFKTASDDYCPRVLDTIPLTGEIYLMQTGSGNTVVDVPAIGADVTTSASPVTQDEFVFGTTAFVRMDVHALADLDSIVMEKAQILNTYAGEEPEKITFVNDLDDDPLATCTTLFQNLVDEVAFVDGSTDHDASVGFSFEWNSCTAPLSEGQDDSTTTTVQVWIKVTFVGQPSRRMLLTTANPAGFRAEALGAVGPGTNVDALPIANAATRAAMGFAGAAALVLALVF
jgi:hypothetical protein